MSSELIMLTFEGTTNSALYDMTIDIPEGKTLILKQARFEIEHSTSSNYPRSVNIGIGSIMSNNYVIDNDAGYNYIKVGLDYQQVTGTSLSFRTISVTYPDSGFKISGRLNKNCNIVLLDSSHVLLSNLVYYFLQFVVV